jgi:hypothetical protein
MPDLTFHVEAAEAVNHAVTPQLAFRLGIENTTAGESIHSVLLRCQILIEAPRRRYDADEKELLLDLFGEPERWGQTLRPMLWTNTSVTVPAFTGATLVDVPVPCTFDFNNAATKYFHALKEGHVPVTLLFSGTVFYDPGNGALQVAQIPWDRQATYRLQVEVWKNMMDLYYPNTAWLDLRRDVFEQLYRYKVKHGIPTWEQTVEALLPQLEKKAAS